jgi:hypothetical protein
MSHCQPFLAQQHPHKSLHCTTNETHIGNPLLFNWPYFRQKTAEEAKSSSKTSKNALRHVAKLVLPGC